MCGAGKEGDGAVGFEGRVVVFIAKKRLGDAGEDGEGGRGR